jgi:hypothetical protein
LSADDTELEDQIVTVSNGGRYEFHLAQRLTTDALATFPELRATDSPAGAVLSGHLGDDAELRDILARMQRLRLRILDVRRLPDRPGTEPVDTDASQRISP